MVERHIELASAPNDEGILKDFCEAGACDNGVVACCMLRNGEYDGKRLAYSEALSSTFEAG